MEMPHGIQLCGCLSEGTASGGSDLTLKTGAGGAQTLWEIERAKIKSPEEILREAQNDRWLQFVVQYSRVSLSLYCLDAIALAAL
jgi:hypothetical protein